jgi:GGDEF domain-containing protein
VNRGERDLSPFRREGLLRRSAPFLVAMILAFAALELPGDIREKNMIITAAVLNGFLILVVIALPWHKLPRFADVIPPLGYLIVVSMLRDAAGATESGYDALYVLPIFWLALYGTRAQLGVGVLGVAVLLGVPVLTQGDPEYPNTEWRRVLLGTTAAGIVGLAVQDLVDQIRQRAEALHTVSEAVGRRTREIETRAAICEAARQVAKARWVCLLEPDANERRLVTTAATAPDVEGTEVFLTNEDSPAVRAFEGKKPHLVQDASDLELFVSIDGHPTEVASALFYPVPGADGSIAVVAAAWDQNVKRLSESLPSVMEALTAEAAGVIERTSLVARLEGAVKVEEITGLPNLRAFQEELPREISRARRAGSTVSVVMLDIGEFQVTNLDGDLSSSDQRLLRNTADRWRRLLGPSDFLAALDEPGRFGAIFPDLDAETARNAALRLQAAGPPERTCSIGVATWDGFELPAALVSRAETERQLDRAATPTPARD